MDKKRKDIKSIFSEALEKKTAKERAAYLDKACGEDNEVRARVEELLAAHEEAGSFLEAPVFEPEVTLDDSPLAEGPGTRIGRYKLLQLIGEGGFGVVYMAEQEEPILRRVALKIIKLGMDTKQVIARFEAERQVLALLDHPNIARVFDAGTTETGRPYFVMEYVKGMSITKHCDEHKLNIEQRLKLFLQVCYGVQHAHQKGIIHRDIKPSNILVSVQDDRGLPKIIDFGVAKAVTQPLTKGTVFTQQGQLLGTLEYMSPEQTDTANQDTDTRADIYSLGVVLYELLTGVLPFEHDVLARASLAEIQRILQEEEPPHPSIRLTSLGVEAQKIAERRDTQVVALARRLHRELEWIPLKAMRKERSRRYRSASELSDDIQNYLNGAALIAGPETAVYRVKKFVRKHAGSVATAALVAAVIVLGLIVSSVLYFRAERAREKEATARAQADKARNIAEVARTAEAKQRQRAEASEEQAQRLLYAANMNLAQHTWEQNNFGRLRQLLEDTAAYPHRGFEWYYLQRQAHPEVRTLRGHTDDIRAVAFSPDSRRIATGGYDGPVKVWDAASGKELLTLGDHNIEFLAFSPYMEDQPWTGNTGAVAFSPDGRRIVTSSWHGTAKVWEANSGKELLTLRRHELAVSSIAFSPDGQRIVTGSYDSTVKVWEANSGKELLSLPAHNDIVWSVAFSPDGRRIITSGALAKVWDAASGKELFALNGHSGMVWSVAFSPDGQRIVTGSDGGAVKVWDADSGKELLTLQGHGDCVWSVAFSPDGQRIVTTDYTTAKVWETDSGKELFALNGHSGLVWSAAFLPDGQRIVTGSADGTARVWEATGGRERILRGHSSTIKSVAFSPGSQRIITGSDDGTAKVWDVDSGEELFTLGGHRDEIRSVAFSLDGQWICTGSADQTAKVWEAASRRELLTLKGHGNAVTSVAFSPDSQRIATGSADGTARVWEANSGRELLTLKSHDGWVQSVAFSPDGQRIVTGSADQTAKIWEEASGKELLTLEGHEGRVWSVAFSPDGLRVVTASQDRTAKVWETASGRELLTLKGHGAPLRSVAFSPDGQRLVTSSLDETTKVWETASGNELLTLKGHHTIRSMAFSPDGQRIVTGGYDGTAQVWEAASLEQVAAWQQEEKAAIERLAALQREQAAAVERYKVLRAQDPGAIKKWLVLAPLAFDGQDDAAVLAALDQTQLPQEATLCPRAGERVKVGEIERTWEAVQQKDNLIDFNRVLGKPTNYSLAYAVCHIDSEGEQTDLVMGIGSGDALKVYLNGREIHRREWSHQNYAWTTAEVMGVQLKAGRNVLVLKVVNQINDWRASIRLTDATGQPIKGIRVTLEPPEEARP